MTFKPVLTIAALAFILPAPAVQAQTTTIVKTGEIVTTTYKMPSAPVSGTTEMMTVYEAPRHAVTTEEVIKWRDEQPVPQPRMKLNKPVEHGHKMIRKYND
jgi:hypothetical protein